MPLLRSPSGAVVNVSDEEAGSAQASGYTPVSLGEAAQVTTAPASEDRGVLGGINAAATGLLAGATLGGSDYALKALLDKGQFERLAQERESHPIAGGTGQVIGAVLPALAAPESLLGRAPSGLVSHATADAVTTARAIGGAEGVGRQLIAGGIEGAVQNAGMYLSDTALGDRELSAEGLVASLGPGFAFGVGGGAAALGIEQGTIAARRLFSRAAGTDKAAEAAQSAWAAQYQATVEANNAAADIARAKLAEARGAREQAALAKQQAVAQQAEIKARTMPDVARGPGAPHPAVEPVAPQPVEAAGLLHDRAMAAMDPAKLAAWDAANGPRLAELMKGTSLSPITLEEGASAAVKPAAGIDWGAIEQTAAMSPEQLAAQRSTILSKAAEEELATAVAEHDSSLADLEDILKRLDLPDIEPGVTSRAVPISEFGEPGQRGALGTPGPHEPMKVPVTDELPPLPVASQDMTRQMNTGELGLTFDPKKKLYYYKDPGKVAAEDAAKFAPHENVTGVHSRPDLSPVPEEATAAGSGDRIEVRKVGSWQDRKMEVVEYRNGVAGEPRSITEDEAYELAQRSTPDGFKAGAALDTRQDFSIKRGLPASREEIADNAVYIARPSELVERGVIGNELKTANRDSILEAWKEGKRLNPIDIDVPESGKFYVEDGNHRLQAAARDDRPVAIRFRKRGDGWKPQTHAEDITERIRADMPSRGEPAATDTLTGQMRSMQSQLGAGADLKAMGAPARAEYAAAKAERTAAAGEHFQGKANAKNYAGSGMASDESAARAAAKGESVTPQTFPERFDEAFHRIDKASGGHDYVKLSDLRRELSDVSREEFDAELYKMRKSKHFSLDSADGRHVRLDEAERAAGIKEAGSNLVYAQRGVKYEPIYKPKAAGPDLKLAAEVTEPVGDLDAFFRDLTRPKTRDAYVAQNIGRAMREEGSHAAALAKVEREWAGQAGLPYAKTAVEDVAAVAEAATKYEKSSARLTEALGPDAPPAAQEAAKAFREAEGHAERKTMERTTRAIDDHAESAARADTVVTRRGGKPAVAADEGAPAWLEEAKRLGGTVRQSPTEQRAAFEMRKSVGLGMAREDIVKADATLAKAKVSESEARIGARNANDFAAKSRAAAEAARPVPAGPGPTSTLGAIATTIGVAGELGVPGIPHPSDIPVIGPLLGTYLKYRAIKAAAGRFVGRIPATGDARAAALVAKTKDKILTAVDRTLGLAAELAPKARSALVATSAALGHRLLDDGEPDAPKGSNAQQQAAVRIREIANAATQPELVTRMVRKEMRGVADPDLIAAAEQHLMARFEALNRVMPKAPPPNPYSKREWVPSPAAAHDVAQRLAVVHNPEAAFHDTTPAKAETLRDTWPRLLEFAQQRLIERVGDLKHPVPYDDRLRNSLLFSVPLDDSMQPDHAAVLQSAHAPSPAAQPPQGPVGAAPSIAGDSNLTALYQTGSDRRAMR